MRNAIANAKLYAEAAGARLGKVLTISEEQSGHRRPLCIASAHGDGRQGRFPSRLEPLEVEARVTVTFELE